MPSSCGAGSGTGRSNGAGGSAPDGARGARARDRTTRGRGLGHARECHGHGRSRGGRHRPVLVRPVARRGPRAVGSWRRRRPDREGVSIGRGAIGAPGRPGARPSVPGPGRGFRRGPANRGGHARRVRQPLRGGPDPALPRQHASPAREASRGPNDPDGGPRDVRGGGGAHMGRSCPGGARGDRDVGPAPRHVNGRWAHAAGAECGSACRERA